MQRALRQARVAAAPNCWKIRPTESIVRLCLSTLALAAAVPGSAEELHLYVGGLKAPRHSEPTYSWGLEYWQPVSPHFSGSFSWLNEGHVRGHHRDGQAVQLWWHTDESRRAVRFEAGVGPYCYFNTVVADNADGYIDKHGWGLIASAGIAWRLDERWLATLRINRVKAHDSIRSTSIVTGLGYRFGSGGDVAANASTANRAAQSRRSELDIMTGGTVVNSFDSDTDLAGVIAWRMHATDHLAGSLSYVNEGNLQPGRRAGFAPQVWLENTLADRISVGVGIGPYFAIQKPQRSDGTSAPTTSALISITASYAFAPAWAGRLVWNRVGTHYNRDTDVVVFGLGYRY